MMKWKARKETVNIGSIELGNITFDEDCMSVSIDIYDMSEELKKEVDKAVEVEKVQYLKYWKEMERKHPELSMRTTQWCDKPVVRDCTYLDIVLESGSPVSYSIIAHFHDAENEHMETCASVTVDLSDYVGELKMAVIKVLLDKFFGQ